MYRAIMTCIIVLAVSAGAELITVDFAGSFTYSNVDYVDVSDVFSGYFSYDTDQSAYTRGELDEGGAYAFYEGIEFAVSWSGGSRYTNDFTIGLGNDLYSNTYDDPGRWYDQIGIVENNSDLNNRFLVAMRGGFDRVVENTELPSDIDLSDFNRFALLHIDGGYPDGAVGAIDVFDGPADVNVPEPTMVNLLLAMIIVAPAYVLRRKPGR